MRNALPAACLRLSAGMYHPINAARPGSCVGAGRGQVLGRCGLLVTPAPAGRRGAPSLDRRHNGSPQPSLPGPLPEQPEFPDLHHVGTHPSNAAGDHVRCRQGIARQFPRDQNRNGWPCRRAPPGFLVAETDPHHVRQAEHPPRLARPPAPAMHRPTTLPFHVTAETHSGCRTVAIPPP